MNRRDFGRRMMLGGLATTLPAPLPADDRIASLPESMPTKPPGDWREPARARAAGDRVTAPGTLPRRGTPRSHRRAGSRRIRGGNVSPISYFVRVVRTLAEVEYPYMIMPDHAPSHPDPAAQRQAFAFAYGHTIALIQAANSGS